MERKLIKPVFVPVVKKEDHILPFLPLERKKAIEMPSAPYSLTSHFPKKHLGQNFLIDHNVRQRIIEACALKKTDTILEIGPGKGTLTELIAPQVQRVIAVETDEGLSQGLREKFARTNVTIVHQDILDYPFDELKGTAKAVGNLPYNIATAIIEKFLLHRHLFSTFYLMIQWEVGLRLTAKPDTKDYGSLSCFVQYYVQPKILFKIKNTAFKPVPKVQSCFMELKMLSQPLLQAVDEALLFKITRLAFQQRRKTLPNTLSSLMDKNQLSEVMERLKISPKARAEDLSLRDFILLSNLLAGII